jgi:hypothetical protein
MRRGQGDFFLSLSLNDFVLTLLFLMLLLAIWSLRERTGQMGEFREKLEACEAGAERCGEQMARLRRLFEEGGFDIEDPSVIERLILVNRDEWRRLEETEVACQALDEQKQLCERQLADLERRVDELTPRDAEGQPLDVASLTDRLAEAEGRLAGCTRQMEQCGLGKPPCWSDAAGKVEFLFDVTLHEDGISVAPGWPEQRAADAAAISGAAALPGERLSQGEFARRATPVLGWSDERECRHYVTIRDRAESKQAYKDQLRTVEGYFYKVLERGTSP